MERCPEDSVLEQLIANELAPKDQYAVQDHLDQCQRCRARIDSLFEVPTLSDLADAKRKPAASPGLKLVMELLQSESPSRATPNSDTAIGRDGEPHLHSTAKPGFIGRLGNINIRRIVGRGGMGIVYEGHDEALDRTVAVKMLSPHLLRDEEAKSRFTREARAAAGIVHENVVAIHAIDQSDGMPYLVLQFVAGESLADRLAREKLLPFDEVLRIGIQLARGLAAAHANGLIHRDIKPGNILLDGEARTVRISDFGLVKQVGRDSLTEVGTVAGTPAFMSPEQIDRRPVDARSDLFAVGVVLYYASSGVLPFAADSVFVVLDQIRSENPKPLREVNPRLPEWFCSIVHRLLAKHPDDRLASAAELAKRLEEKTSVLPVPSRSNRWPRIALALSAALIIVALGTYFVVQQSRPQRQESIAPVKGFLVRGASQSHASLAEAIQAASDGGVIEIHGDGPFATTPIKIEGKRLTIRAAQGSLPSFIPEDKTTLQFLTSDSDLTLEGIDVSWNVPAPPGNLGDPQSRCVVVAYKGRLTLTHCRISCGSTAACVGVGDEGTIEHCHLIAEAGTCIGWRPKLASLRIEQSQFEGRNMMVINASANAPMRASLKLARNTVVADKSCLILMDTLPRQPLRVTTERNLFDCPNLFVLVPMRTFPRKEPQTANGMAELLRTFIAWSEEANVYRRPGVFLASVQPNRPMVLLPSGIVHINQWLEYWKITESSSIDGDIRFEDRPAPSISQPLRLSQIDRASGSPPVNVGADPAKLGPAGRGGL